MPDINQVVPALIGIAILVAIVASLGWMLSHPVLLILLVSAAVLLALRARARNRV